MMFFLLGQKQTGPFVVMLYEMLAKDITCFVTVYSVFLVGFGQAFFIFTIAGGSQFDPNAEESLTRGLSGFLNRIESLFESTLGDVNVSHYYKGFDYAGGLMQKVVSVILFISFTILITGELLNDVHAHNSCAWLPCSHMSLQPQPAYVAPAK